MGGVVSEHCFVWKQICASMNLPAPDAPDARGDFQKLENAIMRGEITSEEMLHLLARRTGQPEPPENYWKTFFAPKLHEPTVRLIRDLKAAGARVVCGSNTIDAHYDYHLEYGQYDCFDAVYASHLIGQVKPDSMFWQYILDAENALAENSRCGTASECGAKRTAGSWTFSDMVFFDDMQKNVEAASSLGIHAHLFTTAEDARAFIATLPVT